MEGWWLWGDKQRQHYFEKDRGSVSYLWDGGCLAPQTSAASHTTKPFISPNCLEPKWNPKDTSTRTSSNAAYAGRVQGRINTHYSLPFFMRS